MKLRPCPFCEKPIPSRMSACPYCHRDEEGKQVTMDSTAPPPEDMTRPIEEQLVQLVTEDPYVRDQAANRLEKMSFAASPRLIEILADNKGLALPTIAKILGRIGDKKAIKVLSQAIRSNDDDLRLSAVWALSQFRDPEALVVLLTEARRAHPITQSYLASVLGSFQDMTAVPVLSQLARSGNHEVSYHAACALGELRSPESVSALQNAYRRGGALVRSAALSSLRRQGASPSMASGMMSWVVGVVVLLLVVAAVYWGVYK